MGGFGGDEFTANFVARVRRSFEEKDFQAAMGGGDGGGGSSGTSADDSEIESHFHAVTAIR